MHSLIGSVKQLQDTTMETSRDAFNKTNALDGGKRDNAVLQKKSAVVLFAVLFASVIFFCHPVTSPQHHYSFEPETTHFNVSYMPQHDYFKRSERRSQPKEIRTSSAADFNVSFDVDHEFTTSPQRTNSDASSETSKDRLRFIIYTFYTQSQFDLYNLTIGNKLSYARLHHYALLHSLVKQDDLIKNGGFVVCNALHEIFQQFPSLEWLMITGADHVIMNSAVKIEDIVFGEEASVLVSAEHNVINFGTYFFRNSEKGVSFMETMCAATDIYRWHGWFDNQFAIEAWNGGGMLKGVMNMLPQRAFNSYPPNVYPAGYLSDSMSCSTFYQRGDFMIHFPGMKYSDRLESVKTYLSQTERVEGIDPRQRCHNSPPPPRSSPPQPLAPYTSNSTAKSTK
jgi:hypothetical protein